LSTSPYQAPFGAPLSDASHAQHLRAADEHRLGPGQNSGWSH